MDFLNYLVKIILPVTRHTPFGPGMLRKQVLAHMGGSRDFLAWPAKYELVLLWELYWSDLKTELIYRKIFSK